MSSLLDPVSKTVAHAGLQCNRLDAPLQQQKKAVQESALSNRHFKSNPFEVSGSDLFDPIGIRISSSTQVVDRVILLSRDPRDTPGEG